MILTFADAHSGASSEVFMNFLLRTSISVFPNLPHQAAENDLLMQIGKDYTQEQIVLGY
jgi:hypothetical protein